MDLAVEGKLKVPEYNGKAKRSHVYEKYLKKVKCLDPEPLLDS